MPQSYGRSDLQQALISASKSMIRVKDPITLMRLITRFIDRQIGSTHVAVLLYNKNKHSYVLIDSKGASGHKIPVGYVQFRPDSPIIDAFDNAKCEEKANILKRGALDYDYVERCLHDSKSERDYLFTKRVKKQMEMLSAKVCIPSFYKKKLIAVLLLGERLSGNPYLEEEVDVFITLANDVAMAVTNASLIDDLRKAYEREHALLMDTASALASAIDARDNYTHGHSARVSRYTVLICKELMRTGVMDGGRKILTAAKLAGLLHDVGKIGIADLLLNKPSRLTNEEYETMKTHVTTGINILSKIRGMKEIVEGAEFHHERWDGKGYPHGTRGPHTPMLGRIIAVADAFDTMTTHRPYQSSRKVEEGFDELRNCAGGQFDPTVVEAFERAWRRAPRETIDKMRSLC